MIEQIPALLAVVVSAGTLIYTIVSTRSKATAEKVHSIERRVDAVEDRATRLESDMKHVPDKDSAYRIELTLQELRGQLSTMSAEMRGQMNTLAERVEPISKVSDRLQEFLLEQAERR
ncbi:MAG: DUF2730 family protein [Rhodopseudomonas sp.]|nr:DUF2730 family protein [Rhodopseudomonas sp.]